MPEGGINRRAGNAISAVRRGVSPDRTQTLEVLGTKNLLDMLRDKLEAEGVGVTTAKTGSSPPILIEALMERRKYDIALPITKPSLTHNVRKLEELRVDSLQPIFDQHDLAEPLRRRLKIEFMTPEVEVHGEELPVAPPIAQELVASITSKVMATARLPNVFARLCPLVREYVSRRCFGRSVDLNADRIRSHLHDPSVQDGIVQHLARKIGELTVERRSLEFERAEFRLSETRPFLWRRDLLPEPLECERTIFNYVATYNPFERGFAEFLDAAKDVARFANLGTTQQGESGTEFRVDYLKPSGAIGFYHPDWVVVQNTSEGEVNWIVETKCCCSKVR